jgi:AraC-like DNA-binding protein
MSPAGDDRLADIREAQDRLAARGVPLTEENLAAELHMSPAALHALMRQLFSEGRRVAEQEP